MWDLVSADSLTEYYGTVANLVELFASGPFHFLEEKQKEFQWQKFILTILLRG